MGARAVYAYDDGETVTLTKVQWAEQSLNKFLKIIELADSPEDTLTKIFAKIAESYHINELDAYEPDYPYQDRLTPILTLPGDDAQDSYTVALDTPSDDSELETHPSSEVDSLADLVLLHGHAQSGVSAWYRKGDDFVTCGRVDVRTNPETGEIEDVGPAEEWRIERPSVQTPGQAVPSKATLLR